MAVVSHRLMVLQQINPIRHHRHNITIPEMMASSSSSKGSSTTTEIVEEEEEEGEELPPSPSPVQVVLDMIYVALGKEVNESKLKLSWVLRNSRGGSTTTTTTTTRICILHVLKPAERIPYGMGELSASKVEEHIVKAYREKERRGMEKLLLEYITYCELAGVHADILHVENDSIQKGILELISQHGIKKLVMGAASDKRYSKKMREPKSKKAIYVRLKAPDTCQIWFVCKGNLIHPRDVSLGGVTVEATSLTPQVSPNTGIEQSSSWRSRSASEVQNDHLKRVVSSPDYRRARSDGHGIEFLAFSPNSPGSVTPSSRFNTERSFNQQGGFCRSPPLNSRVSSFSAGKMADNSASTSAVRTEDGHAMPRSKDDYRHTSPSSVLEGSMNAQLFDQLEQSLSEAESSKQKALDESVRRRKAEKDAIAAFHKAKTLESSYAEELKQRKEIEEALIRGKEDLEKWKQLVEEVTEEIRLALEQRSSLENQIANSDKMVQELEQKFLSAVDLLQKYKMERDELHVDRDNALKVAEELRKKKEEEASDSCMAQVFSDFSFSEIEEATCNFDPSFKIGEGGYGSIFKCTLRHTEVAIKMLHSHSSQGPQEFQQEVDILTKLRHPNLVTLIGACPEAWILVYEYLNNGSLEDRLNCRENTPPLSWQARIRIAAELCSVLRFLHSCNIVHGDLKPDNLLLDSNYVSRLSDFGISRVISKDESSSNNTTLCCRTCPRGTIAFIDPEFLATGELTAKSDTYSFGVILLRLLTGRPAIGIAKQVRSALDKGNLKDMLDTSAGDWPYVQAQQLANLALRCCEMNREKRPDLTSDVWKVLEPMRLSTGPSSCRISSEENYQIPRYFICPIFQEIMEDPHVAADGFTYELEAVKGWLDSGHDTSPMTHKKLPHCNLVPNIALRSAIQEWREQP